MASRRHADVCYPIPWLELLGHAQPSRSPGMQPDRLIHHNALMLTPSIAFRKASTILLAAPGAKSRGRSHRTCWDRKCPLVAKIGRHSTVEVQGFRGTDVCETIMKRARVLSEGKPRPARFDVIVHNDKFPSANPFLCFHTYIVL